MKSTSFARSSFAAGTVGTLVFTLSGMCAAILAIDKLEDCSVRSQTISKAILAVSGAVNGFKLKTWERYKAIRLYARWSVFS